MSGPAPGEVKSVAGRNLAALWLRMAADGQREQTLLAMKLVCELGAMILPAADWSARLFTRIV